MHSPKRSTADADTLQLYLPMTLVTVSHCIPYRPDPQTDIQTGRIQHEPGHGRCGLVEVLGCYDLPNQHHSRRGFGAAGLCAGMEEIQSAENLYRTLEEI